MAQNIGLDPADLRVREGEYPAVERPLETAWAFWYEKKTADKKDSDQYIEGLKQLGSFNTIEGFYRHFTFLTRPSEFSRDQNLLMFRKGYKPMWEEFPEGGCWIVRIKRKASQNYVNRMWENLILACIGEAFDMPDVVGCVLSTRLKDDVLSVWNLNNRDPSIRFRIGERLKEILNLDANAMIQYKEHMQSLCDNSTYKNARNYMFAPSPATTPFTTPLQTTMLTPLHSYQGHGDNDFDDGLLPPAAVDTEAMDGGMDLLPPAAIDTEDFDSFSGGNLQKAASPGVRPMQSPLLSGSKSPPLSAAAAPFSPATMAAKAQAK